MFGYIDRQQETCSADTVETLTVMTVLKMNSLLHALRPKCSAGMRVAMVCTFDIAALEELEGS
jgi:hypothetical protein